MTITEAQRVCSQLISNGYNSWIVEGYYVKVLLEGQLYEFKKVNNERS